jgi:hypothetical protein
MVFHLPLAGREGIGNYISRIVKPPATFRSKTVWLVTCVLIGISQGCARPDAFRRTEASANSSSGTQKLPFHPNADHAPDDPSRPAVPVDRKTPDNPPFRANWRASLPVGTLLTVRLGNSFSISQVHAGDRFTAIVSAPITVDGTTLVDSGTPVGGRIESAHPPLNGVGPASRPALVRLILDRITVDGKPLALQTSSLFAQARLQKTTSLVSGERPSRDDYRLLKGRQLTFRLVSALNLSDVNSVADRQYPDASK